MSMEFDYVLPRKSVPPQFIVLSIIAKYNGLTLSQLYSLVKQSRCNESFDKLSVKDLENDLNMLRILGLVEESGGVYTVTEKGRFVLGKFTNNGKCL
ncbi:MAG: hypothetical protein QW348_04550 [Ignisphaera sp.]